MTAFDHAAVEAAMKQHAWPALRCVAQLDPAGFLDHLQAAARAGGAHAVVAVVMVWAVAAADTAVWRRPCGCGTDPPHVDLHAVLDALHWPRAMATQPGVLFGVRVIEDVAFGRPEAATTAVVDLLADRRTERVIMRRQRRSFTNYQADVFGLVLVSVTGLYTNGSACK